MAADQCPGCGAADRPDNGQVCSCISGTAHDAVSAAFGEPAPRSRRGSRAALSTGAAAAAPTAPEPESAAGGGSPNGPDGAPDSTAGSGCRETAESRPAGSAGTDFWQGAGRGGESTAESRPGTRRGAARGAGARSGSRAGEAGGHGGRHQRRRAPAAAAVIAALGLTAAAFLPGPGGGNAGTDGDGALPEAARSAPGLPRAPGDDGSGPPASSRDGRPPLPPDGPVHGHGPAPRGSAGAEQEDGRAAGAGAPAAPGRAGTPVSSGTPGLPPEDGGGPGPGPGSPSPAPVPPDPGGQPVPSVLSLGDIGREVARLQELLGVLPPDGVFDSGLLTQVKRFQQNHGIEGDPPGVYGPSTRRVLEADEPSA